MGGGGGGGGGGRALGQRWGGGGVRRRVILAQLYGSGFISGNLAVRAVRRLFSFHSFYTVGKNAIQIPYH